MLADPAIDPHRMIRAGGTALIDGTICPTWDWNHRDDLYSRKARCTGFNVQIACTMDGETTAIGPAPAPGRRHDGYAYAATGLKTLIHGIHQQADLGYIGVEGIDILPHKRHRHRALTEKQRQDNLVLSRGRAAVERAIAHLESWRILSAEGSRYRGPLDKFPEILAAVISLINLRRYMNMAYE